MRILPNIKTEWICFLSTNSRPRVTGWLELLRLAASIRDTAGLLGPAGSFGTLAGFPWPTNLFTNTRALLLFPLLPLRLFFHFVIYLKKIVDFPIFPNPHIRSASFMIKKDLFSEFSALNKIPKTKYQAIKLEASRKGMSKFVKKKGFDFLVVGANGNIYEPSEWMNSKTFRSDAHENLLIEDRQTQYYEGINKNEKKKLEIAAWGKTFS